MQNLETFLKLIFSLFVHRFVSHSKYFTNLKYYFENYIKSNKLRMKTKVTWKIYFNSFLCDIALKIAYNCCTFILTILRYQWCLSAESIFYEMFLTSRYIIQSRIIITLWISPTFNPVHFYCYLSAKIFNLVTFMDYYFFWSRSTEYTSRHKK